MPNWKTYEASTRLLSAIIAAHPDVKLNYNGKRKQVYYAALNLLTLSCHEFHLSLSK